MSSPISVQTLNANNVNETNETYQVENNKIVGIIANKVKQNTRRVFRREPIRPFRSSKIILITFLKTKKSNTMMSKIFRFINPKKKMLFTKGSLEDSRNKWTSTAVKVTSKRKIAILIKRSRFLLRFSAFWSLSIRAPH